MADVHYNVSVYDYKRNKLCDLYDSQNHLDGQAYDIKHTEPIDGIDTLDFVIPYRINSSVPSGAASRKKEVQMEIFEKRVSDPSDRRKQGILVCCSAA